ncbi:hypothetical protein LPJ61_003881 [Coemansia biformis]|uniref:RING-type domain-containing protein n=1 Tax=Coemansia biformis TaxID=1286918 RepID=A0A9W8CVV8_9FUNG|nr:hypothetical protein LPJ61_003881 [Coemansia biformis]
MTSYHTGLGAGDGEEGEGTRRRGRWVNQVIDDFMDIGRSSQGTPVAAAVAPESYLNVARQFGEFMTEGTHGTEHQRFLEGLIMRLHEEANSGAAGPPPASREFIRTLPELPADQCREATCVICKESAVGDAGVHDPVTRLPCRHHFHRECIRPWLELHNTCPMCRHEVPSDDPRWLEQKRAEERRATQDIREMMLYG